MSVRTEIERKFLILPDRLPPLPWGLTMEQAYLSLDPVVRVRISERGALLTVKGKGLRARDEVEMNIPLDAARAMISLRRPDTRIIRKTRHEVVHEGTLWEIDVFSGELEGLVVAEVELQSSAEEIDIPPWAGREVTDDPRYQNANLALHGAPHGT